MVRLPSMILPEKLQNPAAWDTFVSWLTSPPTQLPAPHTAHPPLPAHSLNLFSHPLQVEFVLQQLHNGRSGALHGYTSELLRYAKLGPTPDVPASTHSLASALWKTSLVTVLFNKGDTTDTANYRPISVGESISRLYTSIMVQCLVRCTELQQLQSSTQTWYWPELGTIHAALCPSACH